MYNGTVSLFRKNNQYPCYINVSSNHPTEVFKHITNSIMFRLSTNSSDINIFTQSSHDYEQAQKNCGWKTKLDFKTADEKH